MSRASIFPARDDKMKSWSIPSFQILAASSGEEQIAAVGADAIAPGADLAFRSEDRLQASISGAPRCRARGWIPRRPQMQVSRKALLFEIDGTLADTDALHQRLSYLASNLGLAATPAAQDWKLRVVSSGPVAVP